jgi:2-polyprenyl-3-methyl-5-hydroxy-6-metoxy-1,4-benzoquinol methylase
VRALDAFRDLPWRERLHVRGRWASCPVEEVEREVPRAGRVLEVGCGHGLVAIHLALSATARRVTGSDIDNRKIEHAQRAALTVPADGRPEFVHRADGSIPDGPWDAIVIVDVLYLLPPDGELALLDACVAQLAPGGTFVVKEADVAPRWKHRLATLQEHVATRVLRITAGSTVTFTPIGGIAAALSARGLTVRSRRVDRGYLHPHALVVATKVDPEANP